MSHCRFSKLRVSLPKGSSTVLFLFAFLLGDSWGEARTQVKEAPPVKSKPTSEAKQRLIPESEVQSESAKANLEASPLNDRGETELIGPAVRLQDGLLLLNKMKNWDGTLKNVERKIFRTQLNALLDSNEKYNLQHLGCELVEDSDLEEKKKEHQECVLRYEYEDKKGTHQVEILISTDQADLNQSKIVELSFHERML